MGLLSFARSGLATPEKWLIDWFTGGADSASGVTVTPANALTLGPYFSAVRLIAEDVASLPMPVFERLQPRGRRRATDHPLTLLLQEAANPVMSAMTMRETLQGHVMTWGNGFAQIIRNGRGDVTELWPLRPDRMQIVKQHGRGGQLELRYLYSDDTNGIQTTFYPDEILHIAGLGGDGICGYSLVTLARNTIGLSLAVEQEASAFFKNGSRPGGVLSHPGELSSAARDRIRADWENLHKGTDRAQRLAILEEGVSWQSVGIPPDDAQFLETRKFQVTEIARWFRLPPHKLGDLERATFSNIEEQSIDYVVSTLRPWLVRWEQAASARLLRADERPTIYVEHLTEGLLRGNIEARYRAYATGRQWGWLSANDILELENQNPIGPEGDIYLVPMNMVPADQAQGDDTTAATVDEDPEPDDDEDPQPDEDAPPRSRAERSAASRRRIARTYARLILDADSRLAKLERAEVAKLVRRFLERDEPQMDKFITATESLYGGLIPKRTVQRWEPIFAAFADEIAAEAASEVAAETELDLGVWVSAYVASHVGYRMASALGQLTKLAKGTDPAPAVRERLEKWVDERPDETARWESTQMACAAAREAWIAAGVTHLKWTKRGTKDCPFCDDLDGTVVAIDEPFLAKGAETGLGEKLKIKRDTYHPPLHPDCDCELVPE